MPMNSMNDIDIQVLKAFGAQVRAARLKKCLSQESLADLAGLDRTYIGGVERGERNLSLLNITKIAAALEISPSDLLEGFR